MGWSSRRLRTARRKTLPPVREGDRERLRHEIHARNPDCHWCGRHMRLIAPVRGSRVSGDMATLEHLVPECRGGGRGSTNMVLACSRCNSVRGNHPTLEDALRTYIESAQARIDDLIERRVREGPDHGRKLALRSARRKLRGHRLLLASTETAAGVADHPAGAHYCSGEK